MVTASQLSLFMPIYVQHAMAMQSVSLGFTNRAYGPMHHWRSAAHALIACAKCAGYEGAVGAAQGATAEGA